MSELNEIFSELSSIDNPNVNVIQKLFNNFFSILKVFEDNYSKVLLDIEELRKTTRVNTDNISLTNDNLKQLHDAIHAAEMSIQELYHNVSSKSFDCSEVLLTGLPEDSSLDNKTIVFNFLNKIGAGHLKTQVLNIRQFKPNKLNDSYSTVNLVIKFSSSEVRKFVMNLKRQYGKITYQDVLDSAFISHPQAKKQIFANDLLENDVYKKYLEIKQYFKDDPDVSVFTYEGDVYVKKKGYAPDLITFHTDYKTLF